MGSFLASIMVFAPEAAHQATASNKTGYVIGAIIGILIFCYLIYSLIKPEKF
jgi:K+-transporting ATPase KdpF subunit